MTPVSNSSRRRIPALIGCLTGVILLSTAPLASAALPKFVPGQPKADTSKTKSNTAAPTSNSAPPANAPAQTNATPSNTAPPGNGPGVGAPAGAGAAAGAAAAGANANQPAANTAPSAAAAAKAAAPLSAQERAALRAEIDRALKAMADSLKLTPTQRSQARPILLDHAYQVKQVRERYATQERTQPVLQAMQNDLQVLRDTTDAKMSRVLHSDQMAGYLANRDQWLNRLRARMGVTAPKPTAAQPVNPPPANTPPAQTPPVVAPASGASHPAGTNAPANPAGNTVPSKPAGVSAPVDTTHHR